MMRSTSTFAYLLATALFLFGCQGNPTDINKETWSDTARIISVNGATSEILASFGLDKQLVGVDVASTFPASLAALPRVGHSRQMSAEGILKLQPNVVIGTTKDLKPELAEQLKGAGVTLLLFDQEFTPEGTKNLIRQMADSLDKKTKGDSILSALKLDLASVQKQAEGPVKPKVLFIYARGTGTMMVAGQETSVDQIIQLAGGENAITGMTDFKPLTAEALVKANPDIILLFTSGLESLGGIDGLLEVQGIKETNAGRNRKFIAMDGQLLTGFGPRLGQAVKELAVKIKQ